MIQDKAQFAVNGYSLNKDWTKSRRLKRRVLSHLWVSLRARREAVICCVASLGKDEPFPARCALHPTASQLAEHVHSGLREHRHGKS